MFFLAPLKFGIFWVTASAICDHSVIFFPEGMKLFTRIFNYNKVVKTSSF